MTRKEFWQKIINDLLEDNFAIFLHKKHDINGWSGWCEAGEDGNEFVLALDHPLSFETAIHEYCHYLQWKHKPDLWQKVDSTYGVLIDWLEDSEINETTESLNQSLHDIIMLEHDCESMTINFAVENCIEGFDVNKYVQATNLYLWHYHFNLKFRRRPTKAICSTDAVKKMSLVFDGDYRYYLDLNNLDSEKQRDIIKEYS